MDSGNRLPLGASGSNETWMSVPGWSNVVVCLGDGMRLNKGVEFCKGGASLMGKCERRESSVCASVSLPRGCGLAGGRPFFPKGSIVIAVLTTCLGSAR